MSDGPKTLEERVQRAMLQYAMMRPESAGFLAGTFLTSFLLSIFEANLFGVPNFAWLGVGLAGYAALVWSSYSDPKTGHKVINELLRSDFNPKKLKTKQLQEQIDEALEYRTRITDLINERRDGAMKDELTSVASQFDEWIEEIYDLAERLDDYQGEKDALVKRYFSAEKRLADLKKRQSKVRDERMKGDIENNINSLERQMQTIESLETTMERAKLRLENTLTAMSTIHSQTLLLGAKDIDSSRYQRLQADIAEEVEGLADVLYAMDEVYSESEI